MKIDFYFGKKQNMKKKYFVPKSAKTGNKTLNCVFAQKLKVFFIATAVLVWSDVIVSICSDQAVTHVQHYFVVVKTEECILRLTRSIDFIKLNIIKLKVIYSKAIRIKSV